MNDASSVRYQSEPLMRSVKRLIGLVLSEAERAGMVKSSLDLPKEVGLSSNRVRALHYQSKSIYRAELQKLFAYARSVAENSPDRLFAPQVELVIDEIRGHADPVSLEGGRHLPIGEAISAALELSPTETEKLRAMLAGDYLLFRRDAAGDIIVAHFKVTGPRERGGPTTFVTERKSRGGIHGADGFLYNDDRYVYALGKIYGSRSMRLTMLRRCTTIGVRDLIGIRLGVSAIDNGAFAHAIYCHAIDPPTSADMKFTGHFKTLDAAVAALEGHTDKVPAIVELMDEALVVHATNQATEDGTFPHARPWRYGVGLDAEF